MPQGCRMAHLDRPYGDWPHAVCSVPADAMRLPAHGRIGVGLPANLVIFRARRYSELLSRPQHDRVVLRDGRPLNLQPPPYEQLDFVPVAISSGTVPLVEVSLSAEGGALINTRLGRPLRLNGLSPRSPRGTSKAQPSLASSLQVSSLQASVRWLLLACLVALLATAVSAAGLGHRLLQAGTW